MTAVAETYSLDKLFKNARVASRKLARADRNLALHTMAKALRQNSEAIVQKNALDVAAEEKKGTSQALIDRLTLTDSRMEDIAVSLEQLTALPDPLHQVYEGWRLENGLEVKKVSVPFGVIGMIYESRPNVTVDAAALALKAGSAAILRGSSNALNSNRILVETMRAALVEAGLPADAIQLIDSTDRAHVTTLLEARGKVDLVIPRGGSSLINHVVDNAKVPVVETGVGNCHVFVDATADLEMADEIIFNAKVQRPGVCNSAETLLVHKDIAADFLPKALARLDERVELVGCERTREHYAHVGEATDTDWETEFLDYKLAVRVVDDVDAAIEHIMTYGSMHSESIVTQNLQNAKQFQEDVDAAAVYVNASTRFTDGFVFGFGAEIGISTQKLHARGPMGLNQIVTHKYLIEGNGQIRE